MQHDKTHTNLDSGELSTLDLRSMAISGPQHAHRIKRVERVGENNLVF
jgi:hypothetical protein